MHFLHTDLRREIDGLAQIIQKQAVGFLFQQPVSASYRKPQAMLVEEKSRSVETVEKEPPFAIIRSG